MPYHLKDAPDVPVITIEGRFLGSLEGKAFKETLTGLTSAGKKTIVVDLANTDFIDSSGIGVLISAYTTLRREGGEIRLASLQKRIQAVFLMSKLLGSVFKHYETRKEAVDSFASDPPEPAES